MRGHLLLLPLRLGEPRRGGGGEDPGGARSAGAAAEEESPEEESRDLMDPGARLRGGRLQHSARRPPCGWRAPRTVAGKEAVGGGARAGEDHADELPRGGILAEPFAEGEIYG